MMPRQQSWHVGKEVPITLVAAVIIQGGVMVWQISALSSKVEVAVDQIREMRVERYTKEDARRDAMIISAQHGAIDITIDAMKGRITVLEQQQRAGGLQYRGGR